MEKEKLKLTPYDIMTMMGATDPKLSQQLSRALDVELAKPQYEGLETTVALGKAMNFLARNKPESFDPKNRDDQAALHLAPLSFDEEGRPIDPNEIVNLVDVGSLQLAHLDRGDHLEMVMTAGNDDEDMQVKMRVPKKNPTEAPDHEFQIPVVHRYHSDPADQSLEQSIARLKAKVLDESEFAESFGYYLDEMEREPRYVKQGKTFKKAPNLKLALQNLVAKVFPGETPRVTSLQGLLLKRHAFLHGTVVLNGRLAHYFFFQDLNYGMVAIQTLNSEVIFSRLVVVTKQKPR